MVKCGYMMEISTIITARDALFGRQYYWEQHIGPFLPKIPIFVAIAIGITFDFSFGFVLLLLVLNIKTIGLYSVYYWFCIVIVHLKTFFINGSNPWMVSRNTHIINMKSSNFRLNLIVTAI